MLAHEPRVLWEVVGPLASGIEQRLDRQRFRNPGPYPILLTHALVAPVGIAYRRGSSESYGANAGALGNVTLSVRLPQRYSIHKFFLSSYAHTACGVAGPKPSPLPPAAGATPAAGLTRSSGIRGLHSWLFPHGYELDMLPSEQITVAFGTFARADVTGAPPLSDADRPILDFAFYQRSPWMGARSVSTSSFPTSATQADMRPRFNIDTFPIPTGPDAGAYGLAADAESNQDPALIFGGQFFDRSNDVAGDLDDAEAQAQRNTPSRVTGFAVMIDQINLDNAGGTTQVFMPLANLGGISIQPTADSQARGEYWWEGLAPISLVTPTINDSALVYPLPEPVILPPGKALEIWLQTEGGVVVNDFDPLFNVGVSFCGFAQIPRSPA